MIFLVAVGCVGQSFGGEARVCEGRRGVFSPDGSRIAFECERGGRLAVGVVPVKGGDVAWVASGPGNAGQPAWAADGSLVYAYCHDTNTALAAVRRKATDGGANINDACLVPTIVSSDMKVTVPGLATASPEF